MNQRQQAIAEAIAAAGSLREYIRNEYRALHRQLASVPAPRSVPSDPEQLIAYAELYLGYDAAEKVEKVIKEYESHK